MTSCTLNAWTFISSIDISVDDIPGSSIWGTHQERLWRVQWACKALVSLQRGRKAKQTELVCLAATRSQEQWLVGGKCVFHDLGRLQVVCCHLRVCIVL